MAKTLVRWSPRFCRSGRCRRHLTRRRRRRVGAPSARLITEAQGAASNGLTDSGVSSVSSPPTGFHSVTPRMVVADARAQVEFLRAVFDAAGDVVPGRPAEVRIGDSLVMVSPAGSVSCSPPFSTSTSMTRTASTGEPPMQGPSASKLHSTPRTAIGGRWCATRSATSSRSPTGSQLSTRTSRLAGPCTGRRAMPPLVSVLRSVQGIRARSVSAPEKICAQIGC